MTNLQEGSTDVCGAEQALFQVKCQLPAGHDFPHRHDGPEGLVEWEPAQVSKMRKEIKDLREALAWAEEDRDEYRNKLANYDPSVGFVQVSGDD